MRSIALWGVRSIVDKSSNSQVCPRIHHGDSLRTWWIESVTISPGVGECTRGGRFIAIGDRAATSLQRSVTMPARPHLGRAATS